MRVVKTNFIWDKMRTVVQETAFQIALRNYSKESGGMVCIYVILLKRECMQSSPYFEQKVSPSLVTMKYFSAFLDMRQYNNWAPKISF